MKDKKAQGLTMNTIVIAALVLILLVVMIFLIYKYIVQQPVLDDIQLEAKKKACCASYCIGSTPTTECSTLLTDCNCDLSTPSPNNDEQAN